MAVIIDTSDDNIDTETVTDTIVMTSDAAETEDTANVTNAFMIIMIYVEGRKFFDIPV